MEGNSKTWVECKYGGGCKSKMCVFNHPGSKDCRRGATCNLRECRFNHAIPICMFFPNNCKKASCQFRHPVDQRNGVSGGDDGSRQGVEVSRSRGEEHRGWFPQSEPAAGTSRSGGRNGSSRTGSASTSHNAPVAQTSQAAGRNKRLETNNTSKQFNAWMPDTDNKAKTEDVRKQEGAKPKKPLNNGNENKFKKEGKKAPEGKNKHHDDNVVKNHKEQMTRVRGKLVSLLCDGHVVEDSRSSNSTQTIEVLRKQITELSKQETIYNFVVERARKTLRGEELQLQLKREAFRLKSRLPSLAERREIENRLEDKSSRFIVIQGQTGSGKSSQIAQYVADHPNFKGKKVVVTQPRKIAAITLANRVSEEYAGGQRNQHSHVGKYVGYHVGGQRRVAKGSTRIEFVTEGVMLEKIMRGTKEAFEGIGCIVLDEAHERSIMCDILLGSFKNSEDPRWKNIQIIVTSATIDLDLFSSFFDDTKPLEIGGRTFPVDITYSPVPHDADIRMAVVECAFRIHNQCGLVSGDILCFLPGQDDVIQAKASFEWKCKNYKGNNLKNTLICLVYALYGKQDPAEQAEVFKKQPREQRKVIFATDVAETSLTIDGVVYVVDSGVRKEMMYDPKRNISSLKVTTISKSSAIQRAGRSGRTQPGHTYRLYSKDDYDCMETSTAPEIFRKPLGLALLSLREMNIDPKTFEWISVPSAEAVEKAEYELRLLGAIDSVGYPTELGKLISISQQEPKLVRMIYKGCEKGMGYAAITCACLLPIANIFFRGAKTDEAAKKKRNELACPEGDVVTMYELFRKWENIEEGRDQAEPVGVEVDDGANGDNDEDDNLMDFEGMEQPGDIGEDRLLNNTDWGFLKVALPQPVLLENNQERDDENAEPDDDEQSNDKDLDDSKSVSEASEMSAAASVDTAARPQKRSRAQCMRLAAAFVRTNYLSRKALGLVVDMKKELLLIFRQTKVWKSQPTQSNTPSREDLQRLIFSGYFMNVARLLHTKPNGNFRRAPLQYFGLVSGVNGTLDSKGAIAAATRSKPPSWITFDKVLRLGGSTTLLTTATAVDDYANWIDEECREFSIFCRKTCESLPTERIVKAVSEECIRLMFGRFLGNTRVIEDKLDCSLEVNASSGTINAFSSMKMKQSVERGLAALISEAKEALRHQFIEEEYLGATRVVLSQGYVVQEILYPQEFVTAFLRKLPRSTSDKIKLMEILSQVIPESTVHSVEVHCHDTSNLGIVNFKSKDMARHYFPELGSLCGNISDLQKKIGCQMKEKKFRSGDVARLKISWPLSPATGKVLVTFRTASQANTVIGIVAAIFPGARVINAEGIRIGIPSKYAPDPNRHLPTVNVTSEGRGPLRFQFVRDIDQPREGLDYKITIVNVEKKLDECEIYARLNQYNPKFVKVDRERKGNNNDWYEDLLDGLTALVENLDGIQRYTNALTRKDDFVEQHLMRGGLYVHLDDVRTTEDAYRDLSLMEIPFPPVFQQPVRVEIEYTKNISIQNDLYEYLKADIDRVLEKAKADGVFVVKPNNTHNRNQQQRLATIKLRHRSISLVEKYQKTLLNEVLVCEKMPQEQNQALLFTYVGKFLLENLAHRRFLHWDVRTQFVWVYGSSEFARKTTTDEVKGILKQLKGLGDVDKEILLDKRKGDFRKDTARIEELGERAGVFHVHFSGRNRLLVSGTKTSTALLEQLLSKQGDLFVKRVTQNQLNQGKIPDCELCFCERNEENIRLSECGHLFCMECIFPMLNTPTPKLPIACPSCEKSMVLADITKITNNQGAVLTKFVEAATLEYAEKQKDIMTICPKPGCNQILSLLSAREGPEGGRFVSCDECVSSYCVECSKAMEKPVLSHERESCEENRRGFGEDVMKHVREIQNSIFNLQCPRCKTAFFDFQGCAAVTCCNGRCNAAFCGICLADCGSDAHTHVRTCQLNPIQGEFFINAHSLNVIHKKKRTDDLVEYLTRNVTSCDERSKLIQALRRDLKDLGIVLPTSMMTTAGSVSALNRPVEARLIAHRPNIAAVPNAYAPARRVEDWIRGINNPNVPEHPFVRAAENARQIVNARQVAENARQVVNARQAAENARLMVNARQAAENARQMVNARQAVENARQMVNARQAAENARQVERDRLFALQLDREERQRLQARIVEADRIRTQERLRIQADQDALDRQRIQRHNLFLQAQQRQPVQPPQERKKNCIIS